MTQLRIKLQPSLVKLDLKQEKNGGTYQWVYVLLTMYTVKIRDEQYLMLVQQRQGQPPCGFQLRFEALD